MQHTLKNEGGYPILEFDIGILYNVGEHIAAKHWTSFDISSPHFSCMLRHFVFLNGTVEHEP